MKQKLTFLGGLSAFVFIVNKLSPFEKPFHKLGLRVSTEFRKLESRKQLNKSTRPSASCFHQFSRVWKP